MVLVASEVSCGDVTDKSELKGVQTNLTLTVTQPITGVSFPPLGGREGSTAKYAKQSGEWVGVSGWMSGKDT